MNSPDPLRPTNAPYVSAQLANLARAVEQDSHPQRIGPYQIVGPLGTGGMGTVYKAEQRSPIHRIVAVKLIRLGMDTRDVIARFEAERQALAMMDHPNVARVIDAGATPEHRPYFVMEYVQGEPITSFADRHKLTLEQRLRLFTQACAAVQHAHQKAIIHRDLKPSNILVTMQDGEPWVKVIDFGVAKAIDQRLTEKTVFTEAGQFVGTLEYMSPEQADARLSDVDTRSDVYSLGVVLYELLTGAPPFDAIRLRTAGYHEIQRIIREVDPPRPSTRLSGLGELAPQVASSRQMALDELERQLHRELDWIPLKAMRKLPSERYATANELSDDIQNYLANRPLRAGPESTGYRLRKFLRRNKIGVAASAAMVLLLLGGIVATSWQAVRATRAEAQASQERDIADEVRDFFARDVLAAADPADSRGRDVTVKEALDKAAAGLDESFRNRPLVEAAIRESISDTYANLGQLDLALQHAQVAHDLQRRVRGDDHIETARALNGYANYLTALRRNAEAQPLLEKSLRQHRELLGENHPDTLVVQNNVAVNLYYQGRLNDALPLVRDGVDRSRQAYGADHEFMLNAQTNYAGVLLQLGHFAEAESIYRDLHDRSAKVLGDDHPATLKVASSRGVTLGELGRNDEATALLKQVLEARRRVLGADHPDTVRSMRNYANALAELRQFEDAEALFVEALSAHRAAFGQDHPETLRCLHAYAGLLSATGRHETAEPVYRDVLQQRRKALGETHPDTIASQVNHARELQFLGRFDEAEPIFRDGIEKSARILGTDHPGTLTARGNYALLLRELNRASEAEPLAKQSMEALARQLGRDHPAYKRAAAGYDAIRRLTQTPAPTTSPR
jgi:non-specific serine/threonine protein kinase/serine/threonine-protein kinase